MAWLACTSTCADPKHWTVVEDFKTPSYSYFSSGGIWYFQVKNCRTLTQRHAALTWAAACALVDSLTTYEPRGGVGISGSTYRSAKVGHVDGEEYAVTVTSQTHEAWEGPYVSQRQIAQ